MKDPDRAVYWTLLLVVALALCACDERDHGSTISSCGWPKAVDTRSADVNRDGYVTVAEWEHFVPDAPGAK